MLDRKGALRWLERGAQVPLLSRLPADVLTPVGALLRLDPTASEDAFLFESVERGEQIGRYSYVGAAPAERLVTDRAGFRQAARAMLQGAVPASETAPLPRFLGGLVFSLDWEYIRAIEPRLGAPRGPVARAGLYREVVCFDHLRQELLLAHLLRPGEGDPGVAYDRGRERLEAMAETLDRPLGGARLRPAGVGDQPVAVDLDDAEYAARVAKAKRYIGAGDCFQVVIARGFERETPASGLSLYRALRMVNPSPYMFYLRQGDRELAGASPEMLCRVDGREVITHPIAGTRRRGADASEDAALAADLLADRKERAEHSMLVDLARNDVGRVCAPGTVHVTRHMEVERFSHVMHLVSEVRGRLADGRDAIDALDACFPAGTVSGAPKVRAIEIIQELEARPRGPYAGAVGVLGSAGALDTCIAIRTTEVCGGRARWVAGAGIVWDSVPEAEAEETRAKAQAMVRALSVAERGADG